MKNRIIRNSAILLMFLSFGDLIVATKVFAIGINDFINDGDYNFTSIECFYKRPHLSLLIFGTLVQSTGTLVVAFERMVAILFPYFYFTTNYTHNLLVVCIVSCALVLVVYVAGLIVAAGHGARSISQDLCFPSIVINETYSGFLYLYPIIFGCLVVACYIVIFGYICRKNCRKPVPGQFRFEIEHRGKQMWLLKISSILAFNTFVFIVVPYIILVLSRSIRCPTSLLFFLRQYVSFFHAINSFLGLTISLIASQEVRTAVTALLCCTPEGPRSPITVTQQLSLKSIY